VFSWYKELSGVERRTFWACFSGWTMDAMDAQIFSFLIPTLMIVWKVNSTQAGYLGTAALIATGVGGWISGVLADRYGRVRIMQLAIIWFAFFTLLAGFVQSYHQMLFVRMLQGIGFGGEWGAGAVLMGEIIRPEHRGKAVGTVQSGYGVGWTLATILSTAGFLWLPPAYAWRVLLWVGALPAILVIFIQRNVQEPPVFLEARNKRHAAGDQPGFFAIFHKSILRTTVLASLLALGVIGAGSAIIPWLPTFMKTVRHLSVAGVGTFMTLVTTGAFMGFIGSAYLSDFVGRRRNFLIFSVMSWIVTLGYMYLPLGHWGLVILSFPFGFFTQGSYASLGPYFTELFPTSIRGAGQSFSYNFGKGVGALSVVGVGWLATKMPLGKAIGAVSLVAYLLAITATILLPETRGLRLSADGGAPLTEGPNSLGEEM
jgi:MFS family permease